MNFTEQEAKAKMEKRVQVRDDSFLGDGVTRGTLGTVVDARSMKDPGAGPGQVMNSYKDLGVVSVRFDKPPGALVELIGKDLYDKSLKELP